MLKEAILRYLRGINLGDSGCRVIVHIYSNLRSLSREVIEESGAQPRALASFAAGFSREELTFDFVDVGDENIVQAKIMGEPPESSKKRVGTDGSADKFMNHVKDVQCKHILFGASGFPKYTKTLQQSSVHNKKITLLQGTVKDTEMLEMGLKRVAFSKVFRYSSKEIAALPGEVPAEVVASGECWDHHKVSRRSKSNVRLHS